MSDTLLALGLKVPDLIAGFAGGVVNAFVMRRSDPFSIVGSVVVGALTANYISEPAGHYIGTGQGATAFIVGLGAMAICQGIIEAIKKRYPSESNADTKPQKERP